VFSLLRYRSRTRPVRGQKAKTGPRYRDDPRRGRKEGMADAAALLMSLPAVPTMCSSPRALVGKGGARRPGKGESEAGSSPLLLFLTLSSCREASSRTEEKKKERTRLRRGLVRYTARKSKKKKRGKYYVDAWRWAFLSPGAVATEKDFGKRRRKEGERGGKGFSNRPGRTLSILPLRRGYDRGNGERSGGRRKGKKRKKRGRGGKGSPALSLLFFLTGRCLPRGRSEGETPGRRETAFVLTEHEK